MMTSRRSQWLLAAAIATLPAIGFISSASAQYQSGQNGHALDANMQVGSGGQNQPTPNASAVTGNQIVTGNVTGGRYFRGGVPYFDPNSFDGPTASQQTDAFIRDSTGVPTAYQPAYSQNTPRAFYSTNSLTAPPPPGTIGENFTGTVVGTALIPPNNSTSLVSGLDALRNLNLGNTTVYGFAPGTLVNSVSTLPPPGTEDNPLYTANPLVTGGLFANTQQFNPVTGEATQFSVAQPMLPGLPDRFGNGENTAEQLGNPSENLTANNAQTQITNKGILPAQPPANTSGALQGTTGGPGVNGPNNRNLLNSTQLNNSMNPVQGPQQPSMNPENPLGLGPTSMLNQQPMNQPLTPYAQNTQTAPMSSSAFNNSIGTNQSSRQWLLVPPAQQSAQYKELQQRLDQYNSSHALTDQEASDQFRREQQLLLKAPGAGGGGPAQNPGGNAVNPGGVNPGGVNPGGLHNPAGVAVPSGNANAQNPGKQSDVVPLPLRVTSLADGFRNADLKGLLSSAEDLMRQDKFASATEKYDAALQMTNGNNPLILLGRANAELGAEFYSRAEADIRRAVAGDSSVLMGQYDLNKMMDPKRLDTIRDDLASLAKDSKEVRPALLLAYIQYNTGHEADASKYLAQAEKLVGNNDPVIELMRTHWSFQSPQIKDEVNKQ